MRKKFSDPAQTTPEEMSNLDKSAKDVLQELDEKMLQALSTERDARNRDISALSERIKH